jgi:hypothetical protein
MEGARDAPGMTSVRISNRQLQLGNSDGSTIYTAADDGPSTSVSFWGFKLQGRKNAHLCVCCCGFFCAAKLSWSN